MSMRRPRGRRRPGGPLQPTASADNTLDQLLSAIQSKRLIPVVGDAIRLSHIFDVDRDQQIGIIDADDEHKEEQLAELSVLEELSTWWAEDIHYPLTDSHKLARVAQYEAVRKNNSTVAKEGYLGFLKKELLNLMAETAEDEGNNEIGDLVTELRGEHGLTFADIVDELDCPRFPDGTVDPLWVLARLPIKIYLTTGHYDFIERALFETNKKEPVTRLCFWNMRPESAAPEHRPDPTFEPSTTKPVVYHLFGMERYPESMVLTEDDYLRFLWRLARDLPGDSGERLIPPYLEAELNLSSLLLLGYRLEDWDLRVLFHGLLNADREAAGQRRPSVAIQIDPKDQPLVDKDNIGAAEEYLSEYFKKANFTLKCQDSDEFVGELWRAWQAYNQGTQS